MSKFLNKNKNLIYNVKIINFNSNNKNITAFY